MNNLKPSDAATKELVDQLKAFFSPETVKRLPKKINVTKWAHITDSPKFIDVCLTGLDNPQSKECLKTPLTI